MTDTPQDTIPPIASENEQFEDYWAAPENERFTFPDGKQWVEYKVMTEGDKKLYQKRTNRDITITRDQNTKVGIDPAEDRHILLEMSIVDWHMVTKVNGEWQPVDFGKLPLRTFLERGNPKVIQDLEADIRMANPWMQADMTDEEIDKEIARLEEIKKTNREREAAKGYSSPR